MTRRKKRLLFGWILPIVLALAVMFAVHEWGPNPNPQRHTPSGTVIPATRADDGTAHATLTESLATGVRHGCGGALYYTVPYLHCYVDLDPGPTIWTSASLAGQAATTVALVMAAKVCRPVAEFNGLLGAACEVAVTVNGLVAVWTLGVAASKRQCFQENWDIFPVGVSNPYPVHHGGFHWRLGAISGETYAIWNRDDACVVNGTDPWIQPPYGWYPGNPNPWFYLWHCGDPVPFGYYPPQQRLNFDGTSCASI